MVAGLSERRQSSMTILLPPQRQGNRMWVTAPSSGLALLGHLLPAGACCTILRL